MSTILQYLSFALLGMSIKTLIDNYLKNLAFNKNQLAIKSKFELIFTNFKELKFIKRINSYAYFVFNDWELIFNITENSLFIFYQEKSIASSESLVNKKTINQLIKKINRKWSNDINNTVRIGDTEISINYVNSQISEKFKQEIFINQEVVEYEFSLDEILDKINLVGYKNLTNEEKYFLKNYSK
jgi:hypothetical protein